MFEVVKKAYAKFYKNIEREVALAMKQIALVNNK